MIHSLKFAIQNRWKDTGIGLLTRPESRAHNSSLKSKSWYKFYAIDVQGDFEFEAHILQSTPCDVHTFDCTYDLTSLDEDNHHHYHKWCLGDRYNHPESLLSPMFKTYTEIVRDLNHSSRTLDVLKIDIEGYEHQGLSTLSEMTPNLPSQVCTNLNKRHVGIHSLFMFLWCCTTLSTSPVIFNIWT